MNRNEIFSLSLDIGAAMIRSGGEIHRAKDTIVRINDAYSNEVKVFALPTLIIGWYNGNIELRQISGVATDLSELARLNALSRRLCLEENEEINITRRKLYTKPWEIVATIIATSAFCIFFGGNMLDALFSGITGVIIAFPRYKRVSLPLFSSNLIDAFIASIIAYIPTLLKLNTHPDKIIIGTIMLLVPGLTVSNAMRDMMNGDLIAGLIELTEAIMSALAIALGVAGATVVLFWIY